MTEPLRWETDRAGDTLWRGSVFLGCTYNRGTHGGYCGTHGWRALAGEDLEPVGDVVSTLAVPDARMAARRLLEAHVEPFLPLPTAAELLSMTNTEEL